MSYSPTIIDTGDYEDIRVALGLDVNDTTTLPAEVIEGRPFLRFVEGMVKQRITTYATILATAGDKADTLKLGVVLGTAAQLAANYLHARQSEEVKTSAVGPYTTTYREGVDWTALAAKLAVQAAEALARVLAWSASPTRLTFAGVAGPTRRMEAADADMSVADWREWLEPPAIRGHVWTEDPEDVT